LARQLEEKKKREMKKKKGGKNEAVSASAKPGTISQGHVDIFVQYAGLRACMQHRMVAWQTALPTPPSFPIFLQFSYLTSDLVASTFNNDLATCSIVVAACNSFLSPDH